MLQPVERRLAGQSGDVGPPGLERVGQQAQNWIVSQLVMVVDVLVAKRNCMPALCHQRLDIVHHMFRSTTVTKAACYLGRQSDGPIRLAQQCCTGIRRNGSAVESTHNSTTLEPF